jgi:hypothetical protein
MFGPEPLWRLRALLRQGTFLDQDQEKRGSARIAQAENGNIAALQLMGGRLLPALVEGDRWDGAKGSQNMRSC